MTDRGRVVAARDVRFTAVLTRPAGQSAGLARMLGEHGLRTVDFPLLEIAGVRAHGPLDAALAGLERYRLAIFVSPNAVAHAFARLDGPWPAAVPIGILGPGSARALAALGVTEATHRIVLPRPASPGAPICYDSESLMATLDAELGVQAFQGASVLLVRGDGGREWLSSALRARGATVHAVAAYRRGMPRPDETAWRTIRALLDERAHLWVLSSSEAVRNLDTMAREHLDGAQAECLRRMPVIALHRRIADTARALGFDSITTADAGDDNLVRAILAVAQPHAAKEHD